MESLEDLLVPWEDYRKPDLFNHLQNIASFNVVTQFPAFVGSGEEKFRALLVDRIYQELFDVVQASGFDHLDQIQRFTADDHAGANFTDDDNGFRLGVARDYALHLEHPGSSFERFYKWYTSAMPHLGRIVASFRDEYQTFLNSRKGSQIEIQPTRSQFIFRFRLFDFKRHGTQSAKNSNLLQNALDKVPGEDGTLVKFDQSQLGDMSRIDLKVSRWHDSPTGPVREVFDIEAPGNRDYGTLWLTFSYIAESFKLGRTTGVPPNFEHFFNRVDLPVNEFLQTHCLRNFLASLTEGYTFSSSVGQIP